MQGNKNIRMQGKKQQMHCAAKSKHDDELQDGSGTVQ